MAQLLLLPEQNDDALKCVGSCNGWLAFLDNNGDPFLLNRPSNVRIQLPPKQTLPHHQNHSAIIKLVVSSHAAYAVVMYSHGLGTKIAFCRQGDQRWRGLDCQDKTCYDVVFYHRSNTLFALANGPTVESWDLTQSTPMKTTVVRDCRPATLQLAHQTYPGSLYSTQWYLAVSPTGEIFLTVRFIGEFVRHDGEVVREGDTLTDNAVEPLICPYKTVDFYVFKLDGDRREWVDVDCLNEAALFVGVNQSVMVSSGEEVKGNSIYFTDDYWERIDEDYSYGGHDLGVFSMEDGSIQDVVQLQQQQQRIHPPPFWVIPHDSSSSH